VPALILEENGCSQHSTTSRREMRLRTESVTTAACKREPNALAASSLGSFPRARSPQTRAAHPLAAMLGYLHRDPGQLHHLPTHRIPNLTAYRFCARRAPAASMELGSLEPLWKR
jgi:hypothetical protein